MNITVSIGLSYLTDSKDETEDNDEIQVTAILREADRALYYIKQMGEITSDHSLKFGKPNIYQPFKTVFIPASTDTQTNSIKNVLL